jgi:hypothetical protein
MPIRKRWIESWSAERIKEEAPAEPGIYEIGGSRSGQRLDTDVLYVGKGGGEDGIMGRLLRHKHQRNIPPAEKFRYKTIAGAESSELADTNTGLIVFGQEVTEAESMEREHLRRFGDGLEETPIYNNHAPPF